MRTSSRSASPTDDVIDPKTGKIYQGLGRVSENGRILYLRGYVGASLLGRTENWVRASDKELTEAGLAP